MQFYFADPYEHLSQFLNGDYNSAGILSWKKKCSKNQGPWL